MLNQQRIQHEGIDKMFIFNFCPGKFSKCEKDFADFPFLFLATLELKLNFVFRHNFYPPFYSYLSCYPLHKEPGSVSTAHEIFREAFSTRCGNTDNSTSHRSFMFYLA